MKEERRVFSVKKPNSEEYDPSFRPLVIAKPASITPQLFVLVRLKLLFRPKAIKPIQITAKINLTTSIMIGFVIVSWCSLWIEW